MKQPYYMGYGSNILCPVCGSNGPWRGNVCMRLELWMMIN